MENDVDYVQELSAALLDRDTFRLRELSDQCSDAAFIDPGRKIIQVGIIGYAFHKILLKRHYQSKFGPLLSDTLNRLESGDLEGIIENIKVFDRRHGFFQGNVVKKARIKIGARLYTRGMSLGRAADLVGVNVSDILKYSGGTQVHEKTDGKPLKERLDTARRLLG